MLFYVKIIKFIICCVFFRKNLVFYIFFFVLIFFMFFFLIIYRDFYAEYILQTLRRWVMLEIFVLFKIIFLFGGLVFGDESGICDSWFLTVEELFFRSITSVFVYSVWLFFFTILSSFMNLKVYFVMLILLSEVIV